MKCTDAINFTAFHDYNSHIRPADLKEQILQSCLVSQEECLKGYLKLCKRLLNVTAHNSVVIYSSVPSNKTSDYIIFRLQITKGLPQKQALSVPHPVCGHPSTEPAPKQRTESVWPSVHRTSS